MLRTRRQFLELARAVSSVTLASGALSRIARAAIPAKAPVATLPGAPPRLKLNPATLERFADALPIPAIARRTGTRPSPVNRREQLPFYRVAMTEFTARLHRDLPPTRLWGYGGSVPGPTFVTRAGQGILIEWVNELPRKHFLPIDHTLHGAESDKPEVRTVVHVHGAKSPPASDGYPEDWQTPGQARICHYPNEQDAATLWYHDHAMGITRLNIFAGLLGMFIIADDTEDAHNLPSGEYDIPLLIFDRALDQEGQLLYPVSGTPGAPFVAEFYGNTLLCNGKIFPYLEVEPRKYRFRVLNAGNSRFLHLSLSGAHTLQQIGSDQGLLAAPIELSSVLLFPGERADVVVDFGGLEGQEVRLRNEIDDLLQFRVLAKRTAAVTASLPAMLRSISRTAESEAMRERVLTLSEHDDPSGTSMQMFLNESHWAMPVTEKPVLNTTEIWAFVNLSGDAHPMHLHLVRFQILDRRPFDLFAYQATKTLVYTGPAVPPDANEMGWKDTVRADPGFVTRIIVRFTGYLGRYVWHCHVLEHEDNEMMRPYEVVASASS